MSDEQLSENTLAEPPGMVTPPAVDLPTGYAYGVTRYADIILREAFRNRFDNLIKALSQYQIDVDEVLAGGGNQSSFAKRFDASLGAMGWGKQVIRITKVINDRQLHSTRGHEIDMFCGPAGKDDLPGIAVEMEWNNKDPFFDRDLLNFQALHREGALAVGAIVTRGPQLQRILRVADKKFGQSTTHWNKLIPRVNLGGGGECPLLLIGIEPKRVRGIDLI